MMADRRKAIGKFFIILLIFAALLGLKLFEKGMNEQNTTALVMSYEYGFIARGFIGTLVSLLAKAGMNLYSYTGAMVISAAATVVLYAVAFVFFYCLLSKCDRQLMPKIQIGILFLSMFLFSEFVTVNNFGRLDEYLMILTVVCLILLTVEKGEWLIIPLCGIAVCVHSGFVFTNVAIILVLLFWKAVRREGRERRRYAFILAGTFLVICGLFLYFQLFRHNVSMEVYQEIVDRANQMAPGGKLINDAYSLLDSELLGKNVFADEWVWHTKNYVEFPIFLVLFLPYLILGYRFFRDLIRGTERFADRILYFVMGAGMVTILPELILKVDYGRWMFAIIAYYVFLLVTMMAMGDAYFTDTLKKSVQALRKKCGCWWVLLIYPIVFVPFRDVYISDVTTWLMDHVVARVLGLW